MLQKTKNGFYPLKKLFRAPPKDIHVHFIGVCGYIMSAMAVMLREAGYKVSGSDENAYYPGVDVVNRAGIKYFDKYLSSNLNGQPDLVIIGNDINSNNPEAREAIRQKLKISSLPALIGKIFANKKKIVVAGTHGKTTTTAFISWILETAGLNPSYLIGGIMRNTQKGFNLGKGKFFVIEGDEYRTAFFDKQPKIFHYKPDIAVLNNCEFDHPDYFKNMKMVKDNFWKFLRLVPANGLIICGTDDLNVASLFKKVEKRKVSYGLNGKADYQGFDLRFKKETVKFGVKKNNKFLAEFKIQLPGKINVENALAAIAVADYCGIGLERIQKGVASFKGVKRRFEIIGRIKGVVIIDDYAHHPTKIKKTLVAARTRYNKNKIYCVFEPHTYSRTSVLLSDYAQAFNQADEVIVTALMPAREKYQKPSISSREVVEAIKKYNSKVLLIPKVSEILRYLNFKVKKGDVVIIMSVGGLNNLASQLAASLKK